MINWNRMRSVEGEIIENIYVRGSLLEIELKSGKSIECSCGGNGTFWGTNIADSGKVVGEPITSFKNYIAGKGGMFEILEINKVVIAYAETNFVSIKYGPLGNSREKI